MTKTKRKFRPSSLYLALVIVFLYLPIALVAVYSFNAGRLSSVWEGFSLRWYSQLFRDKELFEALWNSIVLGVCASCAAAVIGTLGAVGFQRLRWRSKGAVEYLSTLPMMTPEIILGMVSMAFFSLIGLPFGMTTLIIGHTSFCIPYVYMLVKARLVGMDKSLVEAARDLGAGEMRAFFDVTLPQLLPAIASGMLLSFVMSFDDVIISLFVTGVNVNTLPIKIYTSLKTGVTPEINALCVVMLAVTVVGVVLSTLLARLGGHRNHKKKEDTP